MKILLVVSLLIPLALGSDSESKCSYQDQQSGQCQSPGGKNKLGKAETDFAFSLYKEVTALGPRSWTDNVIISPISIFYPFLLLLQGSGVGSETYKQIYNVLRLKGFQNDEQLNEGIRRIINQLNIQREGNEIHVGSELVLGERTMLKQSFQQIMDTYYKTEFKRTLFIQPSHAEEEINEYISKATKNKIRHLVDDLKSNTNMVLTSYLYFKGEWKNPFNRRDTREESFTLIDGQQINVPAMHKREKFKTYRDESLQTNVILIPYKEGNTLIIAVPRRPSDIHRLGQRLTIDTFQKWLRSASTSLVELVLPKSSFSVKVDVKGYLERLGMDNVFDNADFSGMTGHPDISLDTIFHQTILDLCESGTEASGATAVTTARTTPPLQRFNVLSPFIFILANNPTNTILAIGKTTNPTISN